MASNSGACRVMQGCPISTVSVCARVRVRGIWENPTQPYIGWAWTTKHASSRFPAGLKKGASAAPPVPASLVMETFPQPVSAYVDPVAVRPAVGSDLKDYASAQSLTLATTYRTLPAHSAIHSAAPLHFDAVSAHA